jgi:D-sedoheptulose 7-phosphate isomerase/D-glycero-D-manno-heptose 1,7-bisphosphate phosphatase
MVAVEAIEMREHYGESPKFPSIGYPTAGDFCGSYFEEASRAANTIDGTAIELAAELLVEAYENGHTVFSCGNGGSASIANHLQCDHLKGVRTGTDLTPRVVSLSSNIELITAISNDIGYDEIFSYQLASQAVAGDVLIAISSSGRSPNIVRALDWATENGIRTIALTGFTGGDARLLAEASVHVDCRNYGVIEDIHQAAMHAMAQFIRQSRMTPRAIATSTF